MSENNGIQQPTTGEYREIINSMGKKEFTLLKMQEYGFWPKDLPTPYERQKDETKEQYEIKQELLKEYEKLANKLSKLYAEKSEINDELLKLRKKYNDTLNHEKVRKDIARKIMEESIARRKERKKQRELEKKQKTDAWNEKKANKIIFIGKGYSNLLHDVECSEERLNYLGLPIIKTDKELADSLCIDYKKLRFLVYHRDVVTVDHYNRYEVPKRKGGFRKIAAPKSTLKGTQKKILEEILNKLSISEYAHGFIKEKSVISGALAHGGQPELVINMDLENFFPTITFERVRGMFKSFGYSGYIASLLAMICTDCERTEIEVRGIKKYVKSSDRILPQGSPASPMITNILCERLDKRLNGLAIKHGFIYTRYADDMSFSLKEKEALNDIDEGRICGLVLKIVDEEGFKINKAKTRFLRKNNCQSITGIVINNEEIGLPRKWIKNLRAAIYNANKLKAVGELPKEVINEISGMAAWAKSVNAERYRDIIDTAMEVIS